MSKPTKWHVRPVKAQISLGVRPVWSESSLSAWRKLGSLATHWAHSEDSDQTGRMPRLIWVFAGRTCHFVGFAMRWIIWYTCIMEVQSDQGLCCALNRTIATIECFKREQRPGLEFAHAQDMYLRCPLMPEDTFSHDAAHIDVLSGHWSRHAPYITGLRIDKFGNEPLMKLDLGHTSLINNALFPYFERTDQGWFLRGDGFWLIKLPFVLYVWTDRTTQTVQTQIRRCITRGLIRVDSVCHSTSKFKHIHRL